MPAQLVAFPEGFRILIDKPIMLFGRDSECDIRYDSRKISRRHCCVAQIGDQLIVRDLGSTNGVRVNGVRVLEGYLRAGDELTVGSHRYQVVWDAVPPGMEKSAVRSISANENPAASPVRPTDSDEPIRLAESALVPMANLPPPESTPQPTPVAPPGAFDIPEDIPLLGNTTDVGRVSPRRPPEPPK